MHACMHIQMHVHVHFTHSTCSHAYTNTHTHMQGGSEGTGGKGGMPCTLCPHPTCKHSMIKQGVSSCPECDNGTLVLDPVSAPKWRLDCNRCSFLIYLPSELHNAKLSKERCEVKPAPVMAVASFGQSFGGQGRIMQIIQSLSCVTFR